MRTCFWGFLSHSNSSNRHSIQGVLKRPETKHRESRTNRKHKRRRDRAGLTIEKCGVQPGLSVAFGHSCLPFSIPLHSALPENIFPLAFGHFCLHFNMSLGHSCYIFPWPLLYLCLLSHEKMFLFEHVYHFSGSGEVVVQDAPPASTALLLHPNSTAQWKTIPMTRLVQDAPRDHRTFSVLWCVLDMGGGESTLRLRNLLPSQKGWNSPVLGREKSGSVGMWLKGRSPYSLRSATCCVKQLVKRSKGQKVKKSKGQAISAHRGADTFQQLASTTCREGVLVWVLHCRTVIMILRRNWNLIKG